VDIAAEATAHLHVKRIHMIALDLLVLIAFVLLIVLVSRMFFLSSKFQELETRLKALERKSLETPVASSPVIGPSPVVTAGKPVPSSTTPPKVLRESAVPTVASSLSVAAHPETSPVPAAPSRTREEWEALIGGKLLNRIGALALIIGVGFFLKYAFDNHWISETTRVLIGVAVGFICLMGAGRTQKKGFQIFSQGLLGGGIAVLYLSVYASFNFYQLVSLPVAFGLMGAVTVIAFVEALRFDSAIISILACLGGFLTPFILSTGEANETGLFTYVVVLDLGVIFILLRKSSWVALEPLSLVGTYIIYFSWFLAFYTPPDTLLTLIFLVLFWAIFHGLDMFRVFTAPAPFAEVRRVVAWSHAALFFGALYFLIDPHFHSQMGIAAVVASVFYFGSAVPLGRRRPVADWALIQYALTAVILLAAGVAIEFEKFRIVMLWTAEAGVLVWTGTRYQRRYLWVAGLVLFGVTAVTLLDVEGSLATSPPERFQLLLNQRALAYVLLAVLLGASVSFLRNVRGPSVTRLVESLHYGWIFLLFIILTVETNDLFRSWMINATDLKKEALSFGRFMTMAGVWSLYALALAGAGTHNYIRPVLFSGVSVVLIAACLVGIRGIIFDPLEGFTPFANIRVYAIVLTVIAMFLQVRWLKSSVGRSTWIPEISEVIQILGVVLLLVLLTGEARDIFEKEIQSVTGRSGLLGDSDKVKQLENLKQLSLSGIWLAFSIGLMVFGIWRRTRMLRLLAIVLFGFTILKVFIYDLSFLETLYRIFSFVALGLILLAVSYLYQKYRVLILGPLSGQNAEPSGSGNAGSDTS
jgi:uncharacterized membrane protein